MFQSSKLCLVATKLLLHGDVVEAMAKYQEARNFYDLSNVHHGMANVYAAQGKYERALTEYQTATGNSPLPNTDIALETALTLEKLGRTTEAVVMYRIGMRLQVNPAYLSGPLRRDPLGNSYASARLNNPIDSDEFDIAFNPEALDIGLFEAAVNSGLGKYHDRYAQSEEALSELNKAIRIRPDFAAAYFYRGRVYDLDNDTKNAARADWITAAKLDDGLVKEKAELSLHRRILASGGGTKPNPSYVPGLDEQ